LSEWIASDYAVGVTFALFLAALRPLAEQHAALLERVAGPVKYAAGFSFSLYLFHAPIGLAARHLGLVVGDSFAGFCLYTLAMVALCAGIAALTERRTPALRRWLERLFARRTAAAALA
jgi:peptidoglycan/LPS O-acetylase OafA/YrhL